MVLVMVLLMCSSSSIVRADRATVLATGEVRVPSSERVDQLALELAAAKATLAAQAATQAAQAVALAAQAAQIGELSATVAQLLAASQGTPSPAEEARASTSTSTRLPEDAQRGWFCRSRQPRLPLRGGCWRTQTRPVAQLMKLA